MEELKIVQPTINEQHEINELAKQVHKLHVNWNPDLFLNVNEVISIERLNNLLETNSIYVGKIDDKIVGSKMLEFAKSIAKSQNCTDMHLTVNPNNENAIKVYEKFGMGVNNLSYTMKL